ncbi:MAG: hypothetical protein ABSD92_09755 [Candidatus Bathyarchaeia archaeon]|jgi:hypothetical protein
MEKNGLKKQENAVFSLKEEGGMGIRFPNDTILKISSPEKEKIREIKDYLLMAYDVEPTSAIMLSDRPKTLTVFFQFVKITPKMPKRSEC